MRGETAANGWAHLRIVISIRSPLTRGDVVLVAKGATIDLFQSTPLMRGETMISADGGFFLKFQSTPLMRGETHRGTACAAGGLISIRSPLTRGDKGRQTALRRSFPFQSAPLSRGETFPVRNNQRECANFNPLPSHEGRQHKPPKIRPDLCQLTQQNHDTPLFGALQAPFCGAKPDIRGAKPTEKP